MRGHLPWRARRAVEHAGRSILRHHGERDQMRISRVERSRPSAELAGSFCDRSLQSLSLTGTAPVCLLVDHSASASADTDGCPPAGARSQHEPYRRPRHGFVLSCINLLLVEPYGICVPDMDRLASFQAVCNMLPVRNDRYPARFLNRDDRGDFVTREFARPARSLRSPPLSRPFCRERGNGVYHERASVAVGGVCWSQGTFFFA